MHLRVVGPHAEIPGKEPQRLGLFALFEPLPRLLGEGARIAVNLVAIEGDRTTGEEGESDDKKEQEPDVDALHRQGSLKP